MTPTELVLTKLPGAKRTGSEWQARCPAHDDKQPSLSIGQGDDGRALLNCHAGCTIDAIMSKLGLALRDLMPALSPPSPKPAPRRADSSNGDAPTARTFKTAAEAVAELERTHGSRSAWWTYQNAAGEPVGVVVRWDRPEGKKIIRP